MRRLMLIAIATVSLAVAGAAGAKSVAVTITKNGYVPKSVSISAGDSVQFTNSDTLAHQIVFKTTMGVSCVPNPLVLQPTQSGTCTFQAAGKFAYSDPNVKGNTFRGTVTVSGVAPPADTLTLAVKPQLLNYGGKVALTGTLSNHRVGENVDVLATPCGQTAATKATTVGTTTGGAFTAVVQPLKNTVYAVKVKSTPRVPRSPSRCARVWVSASWHRGATRCACSLQLASPESTRPSSVTTERSDAGSGSSAFSCGLTRQASHRPSSRQPRSARLSSRG